MKSSKDLFGVHGPSPKYLAKVQTHQKPEPPSIPTATLAAPVHDDNPISEGVVPNFSTATRAVTIAVMNDENSIDRYQ